MSNLVKNELPIAIAAIIIALLFFDYYIAIDVTRSTATIITDWAVIIASTAAGVGVINMVVRTFDNIKKKTDYWYMEVWLMVMAVIVAIVGVMGVYGTHPAYLWIMKNVYLPIDSSVYAMVCFDIVSAFYRVFRARTNDSIILVICAFLIMIRNTPVVGGIIPWAMIPGDWIFNIPSTAASRAFTFVTAIGLIAFAIRTMLGYEKATVGVID